MKRKLALVALAVMALSFSGFAEKRISKTKINFNTEKTGNFECTNISSSDLILFAGKIERNFILGGIKSGETRLFDLSKISEMPERGVFIMRAVPYETYKTKEKLNNDDVVYTKLVMYDLNSNEKSKINIIPPIINKYGFIVGNETPFVVELRLDYPKGTPIATLPPHCNGFKVYGLPDEYGSGTTIFPVYIYGKNGVLYAYTGEKRNSFRVLMNPIDDATFCRIHAPETEELQDVEPVNLFGE